MDWILRDTSFLFVQLHADWILTGNGWMMKVTKMQDVFGRLLKQCFLYCSPQKKNQNYYKQDLGTKFPNFYRTFPAWRMTNCEIGASLRRNRIIWWPCGTPAIIRGQSFAKIICNYLTNNICENHLQLFDNYVRRRGEGSHAGDYREDSEHYQANSV